MKKLTVIAALTASLLAVPAIAAERGSEAEAQKMVADALALIKSAGPEKA